MPTIFVYKTICIYGWYSLEPLGVHTQETEEVSEEEEEEEEEEEQGSKPVCFAIEGGGHKGPHTRKTM